MLGQAGDVGVDRLADAGAHQEADVVAGSPGGLGRFVGLEVRWEHEVEDGAVVGGRDGVVGIVVRRRVGARSLGRSSV